MIRSPTHIFHETNTPTGLDQKFRRAKMFEHLWYRGLNQPCFFFALLPLSKGYTQYFRAISIFILVMVRIIGGVYCLPCLFHQILGSLALS